MNPKTYACQRPLKARGSQAQAGRDSLRGRANPSGIGVLVGELGGLGWVDTAVVWVTDGLLNFPTILL